METSAAFQVPWRDSLYRLLSLWDMKTYLANRLTDISSQLLDIDEAVKDTSSDWRSRQKRMVEALRQIVAHCEFMSLDYTKTHAYRCMLHIEKSKPGEDWEARLDELDHRFRDEIYNKHFIYIAPDKFSVFQNPTPFGQLVHERFPYARKDIAEAAKCLALERHDACVFHLMRALEHGLKSMAVRLVGKVKNPNWHSVIGDIEKEIARRNQQNALPPRWKKGAGEREFFHSAALHFRYLKDPWRNSVSHASGVHYDIGEAETIFEHTRDFMQHLATKLKQRK